MATRWVLAFSIAAWLALVGCATVRHLARASRARREGDARQRQLRRMGGPVLAVATLAGWLASPSLPSRLGVAAATALGVALIGLVDDRRSLPPLVRLGLYAAAGAVVAADGIRVTLLGSTVLDAALTVVWVVVVTNAFRRLDHVDGLVAVTGAVAAAGLFGAAAAGDDALTATISLALSGACLGLLAYNARPASVVPGASGTSFVGFVLAVAAVEFTPDTATPGGVVIPLLLLGLPVLDLLLVTVSRLLGDVPLRRSRRDHLVHRFRARGWSRGTAVGAVLGAQCALTGTAVLVGRGSLPAAWGLLVGAAVAIALVLGGADTGTIEPRRRVRSRGRLALELAGAALVVLAGLGAFAAWQGVHEVHSAQASLDTALAAGRRGDTVAAQNSFEQAARYFGHADSWLSGPLGWPGRAVPVMAENLRAARELAAGGVDVSHAGVRLSSAANNKLQVGDGTVRVDAVRSLTPDIRDAARLLHRVVHRLDGLQRPYLVGPVRDRVDKARKELTSAAREADNGVAAARVTPAVFGADRPRRYFLAVQNNAELRATGGLIGSWGILTAANGKVSLDQFERTDLLNQPGVSPDRSTRQLNAPPEFVNRYGRFAPAQLWQNLNMSPDFPTVGQLIANLYPQSGGQPIDGVIAVDPLGLKAILELTGPVAVQGWPAPITADNVVDVTLRQAYDAFARSERAEFLGDVAEAVWRRATRMNLGSPAHLARVLGGVARRGNLMLWFSDPKEQQLAARLGVAGAVPRSPSDSLLVTTQNAGGNKIDYYTTRHLDYSVKLTPDEVDRRARAEAQLQFRVDNGAPAGVSSVALGPYDRRFQPGEDRSFVSVYSPLAFSNASRDGAPAQLESSTELGRNVFSEFASVQAGTSGTLSMQLDGTVPLEPGGWYALDLVRQPTIRSDQVSVHIDVPPGWRIEAVDGLELMSPRRAEGLISLNQTRQVRVKLARDRAG